MSSSTGRTALLVTAVGVLVGVPVLLGSMWQSWQLMEQTRTDVDLESLHLLRDAGLGHAELRRGAGEATLFGHVHEGPDRVEVDRHCLIFCASVSFLYAFRKPSIGPRLAP